MEKKKAIRLPFDSFCSCLQITSRFDHKEALQVILKPVQKHGFHHSPHHFYLRMPLKCVSQIEQLFVTKYVALI